MNNMEISIDVTYKCPFSCPFCSSLENQILPDMNMELMGTIVRFLSEMNGPGSNNGRIIITGGEPLLLQDLPLFISKLSETGSSVGLCTSAGIEVDRKYWNMLRVRGLQRVFLSLHSISAQNPQRIFGKNYDFSIIDKNIDLIFNAGIDIFINFVITKLNNNAFNKIAQYCKQKNIRAIRILGLAKQGRAIRNWNALTLSKTEKNFLVEEITQIADKNSIVLEFAGLPNYRKCSHTDKDGKCLGGKSFFHINTTGDIYPCPSVKSIETERLCSIFDPQIIFKPKGAVCEKHHPNEFCKN